MHRFVVRVAQFFVTLVVGIAILGSLAVWRLSKGPVSLDFLTPAIESSFAAHELPVAVQVEHTTLVWGGWSRVFDLRAVNVRLFGGDGKIVALLPEVSVGLSMTGLMQGDLALSRLDVYGLRALIQRHPDGRFDFTMPTEAAASPGQRSQFAVVASDLLKSVREGRGLFRYLKRLSVLSAKVKYSDERNRQLWTMPVADMITVFGPEVIESQLRLAVENAGDRAELAATVLHDRKSARIGGRVDFNALEPTLITRAVPHLSQLSSVRLPFSGSAHFEVAADWNLLGMRLQLASPVGHAVIGMRYPPSGNRVHVVARLENVRLAGLARATPALAALAGFDLPVSGQIEGNAASAENFQLQRVALTGGQGTVELPGILPRRVRVAAARLRATVRPDGSGIAFDEVMLDLGGPRLQATGSVAPDGPAYRLQADGTVAGMPMAALDNYWPIGLGTTARQWVTANITEGMVDDGSFRLTAAAPHDKPFDMRIESIDGTLAYQGLSVDYLPPMSKVTGIAGKATFDKTRFDLVVEAGKLRDLLLERAVVNMTDLEGDNEKIAIDLSMRGPARTLAYVLDEQPLGFLGALTLAPKAISGAASFRARLDFPLYRGLKREEVKFAASGNLRKLAIAPAPQGLTVGDGELLVKANNDHLEATGSVNLSGVHTSVDWREEFANGKKERRRLVLSGRVPDMGRPGFGLPALSFLSGPADANVALTQQESGKGELLVNLELVGTALDLPMVAWSKPAGAPGTANATLTIEQGRLHRVDRISVETGDTRLLGSAQGFGSERESWIASVEQFRNKANDFKGRVELRPDGAIEVDLTGKRFDAAGAVDFHSTATNGASAPGETLPKLRLRARVADLSWENEHHVRDARAMVRFGDGHIQAMTLDGRLGRDGTLGVRYLPGSDGQVLRITTDDFGTLLSMSPSRNRVDGGALLIRGVRRERDGPLEGDFYASRFTLAEAPLLARVLQVASLTGIVNALTSKGLTFDAFEGKFAYDDGRIVFGDASAYGSSIGMSGNGVLDIAKDTASASGTVVPAYSLNRVLGNIPVIGSLLTGGKNEGIFAATYRVDGPLDDPKVEVNPLSALAPGFLRNLFGLGPEKKPSLPAAQ